MKKTISIAFLMLFPIFAVAQQKELTSSVGFRARNCAGGIGICTDRPNFSQNSITSNHVLLSKKSNNQLMMAIPLTSLTNEELEVLRNEKTMEVSGSHSLEIPKFIQSKLGIATTLSKISVGSYPITIKDEHVEVLFTLSEK